MHVPYYFETCVYIWTVSNVKNGNIDIYNLIIYLL